VVLAGLQAAISITEEGMTDHNREVSLYVEDVRWIQHLHGRLLRAVAELLEGVGQGGYDFFLVLEKLHIDGHRDRWLSEISAKVVRSYFPKPPPI
jgi:hypothetical protein